MVKKTKSKEVTINLQDKRNSIAGTTIKTGKIYEDYFEALNTPQNKYMIYDKMRRQDYQCKRMANIIVTPLKGGVYRFLEVDDKDVKQIQQAKFKNNLYNKWANRTWQEMLTEILTYPFIGFSLFEPYSKVIDDIELGKLIVLANMGFIKQSTIYEWDIKDDMIARVHQKVTAATDKIDKWIDGEELMIFVNEQEGNNFEGISVFRSAYGNYVRKDLYLKLDMIGNERMAIGTPRVYVPDSYFSTEKTEDLQALTDTLEAYTAHQKSYLVLSDRLVDKFEVMKGEYDSAAVDTSIKREDQAMLDSILAGFLAIGTAKSGGNSQNEGQMELYLNSIMFIAMYIAERLSELAHQYYVLNFGEPEVRLDMTVSNITRKDAKAMMEIVRGYVTSKVIEPDDVLERRMRKDLGLPDKDATTSRDISAKPDYKADQDEQDKANPNKQDNPEPNIEEGND